MSDVLENNDQTNDQNNDQTNDQNNTTEKTPPVNLSLKFGSYNTLVQNKSNLGDCKLKEGDLCFAKYEDKDDCALLRIEKNPSTSNLVYSHISPKPGALKIPLIGQGNDAPPIYSGSINLTEIAFKSSTDPTTAQSYGSIKYNSSNEFEWVIGSSAAPASLKIWSNLGSYSEIKSQQTGPNAVTQFYLPCTDKKFLSAENSAAAGAGTYAVWTIKTESSTPTGEANQNSTSYTLSVGGEREQPIYIDNVGQAKEIVTISTYYGGTGLDVNTIVPNKITYFGVDGNNNKKEALQFSYHYIDEYRIGLNMNTDNKLIDNGAYGLQLLNSQSQILFKEGWTITNNSIKSMSDDLVLERGTANHLINFTLGTSAIQYNRVPIKNGENTYYYDNFMVEIDNTNAKTDDGFQKPVFSMTSGDNDKRYGLVSVMGNELDVQAITKINITDKSQFIFTNIQNTNGEGENQTTITTTSMSTGEYNLTTSGSTILNLGSTSVSVLEGLDISIANDGCAINISQSKKENNQMTYGTFSINGALSLQAENTLYLSAMDEAISISGDDNGLLLIDSSAAITFNTIATTFHSTTCQFYDESVLTSNLDEIDHTNIAGHQIFTGILHVDKKYSYTNLDQDFPDAPEEGRIYFKLLQAEEV